MVHLWFLFGVPAFAAAGFWLAGDHGILWGVLAAVGGALAAAILTPLAVIVSVAVIHVGIKIEDRFKPFPPSARAVKEMATLRRPEVAESPPVARRFDCRPYGRLKTLMVFLLALGGAALLSYFALFLDGPVTVRGVELTQTQGRLFFGAFALLSPIGLVPLGWAVYVAFTCEPQVVITKDSLALPRSPRVGFSRGEIEIPLEAITNVSVRHFTGSSQLLVIEHESGVASLPSSMFHKGREFAELAWILTEEIANRESAGRPS